MNKNILNATMLMASTLFASAAVAADASSAPAKEINTLVEEAGISKILENFSVEVSAGFESEYMFRGYKLADGIASPAVNIGYDLGAGFSVYGGYWGAYTVSEKTSYNPFTGQTESSYMIENDFTFGVAYTYENFTIDVGYCAYTYAAGGNSNEFLVNLSYDTSELLGEYAVNPYIKGFYDFSFADARGLEAGLSYSAPVTKWLIGSNWGTIDFDAYSGYWYGTSGMHSFYTGFAINGSIALTDSCSVSVGMRYQFYNNEVWDSGSRVWFGTGMSIGF